jgi:hypothetical protein
MLHVRVALSGRPKAKGSHCTGSAAFRYFTAIFCVWRHMLANADSRQI